MRSPQTSDPLVSADYAALADAGWPALERRTIGAEGRSGGWIARYAHGVTQRANSVYAAGRVAHEREAIAAVEHWYAEHGLPSMFQLADDDEELLSVLLAGGYVARSETLVLAAEASTVTAALATADDREVRDNAAIVPTSDEPDDEWLDLWWGVDGRGGESERAWAREILVGGRALYATVRDAQGAASVGRLALVDHDGARWGGLYALATRADARGRGHARAVIASLLAHAVEHGVSALWLQVTATNDAARRLYDGLGFRQVAGYRYLLRETGAPSTRFARSGGGDETGRSGGGDESDRSGR
jgi:ribosomal protein S18 acetylase RimI-like enzyme